MMSPIARQSFEALIAEGHAAAHDQNFEFAYDRYTRADRVSNAYEDQPSRLHALAPAARALWGQGMYDQATEKLETCLAIAEKHRRVDEQAITLSNLGRLAAHRLVRTTAAAQLPAALKQESVPNFEEAYELLKDHPHLYYRYANAQHGSVISALASQRSLTTRLLAEGARTALQISDKPFDEQPTFLINPRGLLQMLGAATLLPLGNHTPFLARVSRSRLVG